MAHEMYSCFGVFSVACSPERQKERDISHVYRQWKMIALLWLPSNRSESFVFLLIFPVCLRPCLRFRRIACHNKTFSKNSINHKRVALYNSRITFMMVYHCVFLYVHQMLYGTCYSICY